MVQEELQEEDQGLYGKQESPKSELLRRFREWEQKIYSKQTMHSTEVWKRKTYLEKYTFFNEFGAGVHNMQARRLER